MLKTQIVTLGGKDEGRSVLLIELPALVADRIAREILRSIDANPDGGVVALALKHLPEVRALGEPGLRQLQRFVHLESPYQVKDWHNVEKLQQAALALHVGFIVGRPQVDVPITMRAERILDSDPDVAVAFCSPLLAAVIDSDKATYRELETVLGTEDAYNIVEILNVRAVREWHAAQQSKNGNP